MSAGEELLELAEQGDARAVKRAYARLLRSNRPDDDPEAFQDLHACYQHALALCGRGTDTQAELAESMQAEAREPDVPRLVTSQALPAALDADDAAREIVMHAGTANASTLALLLQERALGWSLQFRADVGWSLLGYLHREDPPVSEANFNTLAQAFDWDDIALDLDPLWLAAVARRCRQAWRLLPESRSALRIAYEHCSDSYLSAQDVDGAVARLSEARSRWRNRLDALLPARARDTPYLLAALEYWPDEVLPPGLNAAQVGFWARFGDPGHRVHFRYGAVRCTLIGLFLGLVTAWGVYSSPVVSPSKGGMIIAVATLLVPAAWLLLRGFKALLRWQCADESDARGPVWLRWAFLPAAAIAVGAAMWAQRTAGADGLLLMVLDRAWAFGLAFIAMTRVRARGPDRHAEPNGLPLLLSVIWPMGAIGLSLYFWATDLSRNIGTRR